MKKLLLFLAMIMLCVACDPFPSKDEWHWNVINSTESVLRLKGPYYSITQNRFESREYEIKPGNTASICVGSVTKDEHLKFDYYFAKCVAEFGENVSWQLLSENGIVLRTWTYSSRGQSDQRFFDKSSWVLNHRAGEWTANSFNTWTFVIIPEDLQ